jgi:hypothetical protein
MIQKVRAGWMAKGNAIAQARFLAEFFGVAAKLQVDFKLLGWPSKSSPEFSQ